jgi:hypothetical protein
MADPANLLIAISFMVLGFDIGSQGILSCKVAKKGNLEG